MYALCQIVIIKVFMIVIHADVKCQNEPDAFLRVTQLWQYIVLPSEQPSKHKFYICNYQNSAK